MLTASQKTEIYQSLKKEILSVLDNEFDRVAQMASIACLASQAFESWFWTGFYIVDQVKKAQGVDELVVGPYQGTLGCLRIDFKRGVCGAAARERTTQIVPDVHAFPGHIACDSRTNSEIVVPVFDKAGELIAVFDVDSESYSTFDETDREHLEDILAAVFSA
ncbi:GAF domain-containing protein [Asticcacaulis sp. YBE204]|uniref:GAF domain-containing protein n=1 Tax=Asticcacaulis sp. YBE204 TaxID=1282363 RepID=UPI0003C3C943|nr:GAF domain-containing protein [Asticcacaulis sp. YBE204]ESQ80203.1 cyclic diguanylate phosphodiesterase [Asticcacaulis sp. YBE204]